MLLRSSISLSSSINVAFNLFANSQHGSNILTVLNESPATRWVRPFGRVTGGAVTNVNNSCFSVNSINSLTSNWKSLAKPYRADEWLSDTALQIAQSTCRSDTTFRVRLRPASTCRLSRCTVSSAARNEIYVSHRLMPLGRSLALSEAKLHAEYSEICRSLLPHQSMADPHRYGIRTGIDCFNCRCVGGM